MDEPGYAMEINFFLILIVPFQIPQQNEIFELLIQQQGLNQVPLREIPFFDDDPL